MSRVEVLKGIALFNCCYYLVGICVLAWRFSMGVGIDRWICLSY